MRTAGDTRIVVDGLAGAGPGSWAATRAWAILHRQGDW
jgi:hypothetical protein